MIRPFLPRLTQKGAMFGIDARLTLIIFASLSTIAGASIFFNKTNTQASVMVSELKAIHTAIKRMQEDFENDLYSSLDTPNSINATYIMFDDTEVDAAFQRDWHGPYLDEFIQPGTRIYTSQNNIAGTTFVSIMKHAKQDDIDSSVTCSNAAPCHYWIRIENIPIKLAEAVNAKIDGTGEVVPDEEGRFQWIETSADITNIWYLTERALDNTNPSLGE
jgi:hypothetical protein